jgi:uncharacterized protein YcbK (DUF882 family)
MTRSLDHARRRFVGLGLTALACSTALPALAAIPRFQSARALGFHNLHTGEKLRVDYWRGGAYDRAALARIDNVLRDHYSGDVYPMDVRLMDLLHDLQARLGNHGAVEVISGYRSPKTNLRLARLSDGVAQHSYHMQGMAVDLRLSGVPLARIHHMAQAMRRGGVGFYPASDFVHVDVGPVRAW